MFRIRQFLALLHARNMEFVRDRGSLVWAIMFPVLIVVGCAFAFSNEEKELYQVGLITEENQPSLNLPLLEKPWITVIAYDDQQTALERLRYHQLDLVLEQKRSGLNYWVNDQSSEGDSLETLLLATSTTALNRQQVSGRKVRYVDWVMPGVLGMNMMFGSLFGVGYVVVRYRQNGVLKRIQATPVSKFQFLAAQVTSRLILQITSTILILTGCFLTLDLIMLGSWWTLLLTGVLGVLSMISLGMMISARTTSEEFAGGMLNLATWPMMFLSGVWFSLENAPEWMQDFANIFPLTHMITAAREIMLEGAGITEIGDHLLILLVITVVLAGTASRLFRWHATE